MNFFIDRGVSSPQIEFPADIDTYSNHYVHFIYKIHLIKVIDNDRILRTPYD